MINQYAVDIEPLGKGAFATVYKGNDTSSNIQYAIKKIKKMNKKQFQKDRAYDNVLEELNVLKTLEHPNVIYLHEIIDDPKNDSIYLVTEYLSKGSLGDKIRANNEAHELKCRNEGLPFKPIGLNLQDVRMYFIDMLKALYYCHKIVKVIHRDIKPDNIMLNHNNEAILIDFGVSAIADHLENESVNRNIGTQLFFAPEMLL